MHGIVTRIRRIASLVLAVGASLAIAGCATTFKRIETTTGAANIRINNSYVGVTPLAGVQVPYSEGYIIEADPVENRSEQGAPLFSKRIYVTAPIPRYLLIDLTKPTEKGPYDVWIIKSH